MIIIAAVLVIIIGIIFSRRVMVARRLHGPAAAATIFRRRSPINIVSCTCVERARVSSHPCACMYTR